MKNTKKIAFLCIAINIILLLQLCLGTVMALDDDAAYIEPGQTVEEAVIEAQGAEMQIMAAASCPTYSSATEAANQLLGINNWTQTTTSSGTNIYTGNSGGEIRIDSNGDGTAYRANGSIAGYFSIK